MIQPSHKSILEHNNTYFNNTHCNTIFVTLFIVTRTYSGLLYAHKTAVDLVLFYVFYSKNKHFNFVLCAIYTTVVTAHLRDFCQQIHLRLFHSFFEKQLSFLPFILSILMCVYFQTAACQSFIHFTATIKPVLQTIIHNNNTHHDRKYHPNYIKNKTKK